MDQDITAAGLILSEQGHVLIVKHSCKAPLSLPGGIAGPGESPRTACAREILEELAIRAAIGQLLVIDWAPRPAGGDRLVLVFDAGTVTRRGEAAIRIDHAEITGWSFCAPDMLDQALSPEYARRVSEALTAYRTGHTAYLENGRAAAADPMPSLT